MPDYENLRRHDTRWTPLTNELRDLIDRLVLEAGTWQAVATATGIRLRYIRRLRQRKDMKSGKALKCVSLYVLDRLLTLSDSAYMLRTLPWYTIEELIEMGIWDQPSPHFRDRSIG